MTSPDGTPPPSAGLARSTGPSPSDGPTPSDEPTAAGDPSGAATQRPHLPERTASSRLIVVIRADDARTYGPLLEALIAGGITSVELTGIDDPAAPAVVAELFDEASAAVDVTRRLWDSWEDDAEIRDVATDRFLDRDKVHRIDAESRFFSARGPSIVPRSPQGAPVVAALAHDVVPSRFAARSADVVFVTPRDADADAVRILTAVREQERFVERSGEPLRVIADLVVLLDGPEETGADRLARLDAIDPLTSDTRVAVGSATELADEIEKLGELGYDGVRLRPAVATDDLPRISRELAPELRRRGLVPAGYEGTTLREHLGLPATVPSRYAPTADLQEAS